MISSFICVLLTIISVRCYKPESGGLSIVKSCAISEFEECLMIIKSVTDSDELAFASTMKDLLSACRKLQHGVKCADDHMRRCSTGNQRQVFEEVVKGTRDVITKLCIPGSTQMKYLKYSGCYRNVSRSETKCLPFFRQIQEMDVKIQGNQHEVEDVDQGLHNFCCTFRKAYECQVRHLREDCGVEALRFFEQNLNEMSNSLIHRHCSSFLGAKCDHTMSGTGNQTEKKGKKKNGIRGRNKLSFTSKSQDRTGSTSTSLSLSRTTTIYNEFTSLFLILLYFLIPRIHFW